MITLDQSTFDLIPIGGEAVGRDKVTSTTETITAANNSIAMKDSDVCGGILINSTKNHLRRRRSRIAQERLAKQLAQYVL